MYGRRLPISLFCLHRHAHLFGQVVKALVVLGLRYSTPFQKRIEQFLLANKKLSVLFLVAERIPVGVFRCVHVMLYPCLYCCPSGNYGSCSGYKDAPSVSSSLVSSRYSLTESIISRFVGCRIPRFTPTHVGKIVSSPRPLRVSVPLRRK